MSKRKEIDPEFRIWLIEELPCRDECEDGRLPDEQVFLPLQCESGSACTKLDGAYSICIFKCQEDL